MEISNGIPEYGFDPTPGYRLWNSVDGNVDLAISRVPNVGNSSKSTAKSSNVSVWNVMDFSLSSTGSSRFLGIRSFLSQLIVIRPGIEVRNVSGLSLMEFLLV
ncbi:hypothetical protein OGAPHI_003333 [Ogataea philodendri]|uniref:Uncharacterized protein n=1 Tax=Ogataea philodendri TaxID=1378263 RepID=A0A9P8P903_9ASCO|nr:uncharacterized protein OGAPHI_003333 [Ogataea philodendri]KAH3666884.1 hypothetical protein OGAPHI_003333 [Ogataea philodendri]